MSIYFPVFQDQLFGEVNKLRQMVHLYQTYLTNTVAEFKQHQYQLQQRMETLEQMMSFLIKSEPGSSPSNVSRFEYDCLRNELAGIKSSLNAPILMDQIADQVKTDLLKTLLPVNDPAPVSSLGWKELPTEEPQEDEEGWNVVKKKKKR